MDRSVRALLLSAGHMGEDWANDVESISPAGAGGAYGGDRGDGRTG